MKRMLATLTITLVASLAPFGAWGQQAGARATPVANAYQKIQAAPGGLPAPPQAAPKATWKSRAEYDAFQGIVKATSPEAKITAADAFLAKYPSSDFKAQADILKFQAYLQLHSVNKAISAAKSALKEHPNDIIKITALNYLAYAFPYTYKPSDPDASTQLSQAQSEAKEGLQALQQFQKPASVSQDAFESQMKKWRADFNRALGFAALEQKDSGTATTYLKAAAQDNPKDSYTMSFLGQAYLASNPPDYNSALWYLARGVDLAKETSAPNLTAIQKMYNQWYEYRHGSNAGEQSLLSQAESSENPPAGFQVSAPPKHAKTGVTAVDFYHSVQDALGVGGDEAQSAWNQYKGQALAVLGYVESVSQGPDPGTYDVKTDVIPQDRGQTGIYQFDLITKQADSKYLKLGDPIHFRGTIAAYNMKPNFVLTVSDVEIDPATLRMAKERNEAAALKAKQRKTHHASH